MVSTSVIDCCPRRFVSYAEQFLAPNKLSYVQLLTMSRAFISKAARGLLEIDPSRAGCDLIADTNFLFTWAISDADSAEPHE